MGREEVQEKERRAGRGGGAGGGDVAGRGEGTPFAVRHF